jgi:hypothetical protein
MEEERDKEKGAIVDLSLVFMRDKERTLLWICPGINKG